MWNCAEILAYFTSSLDDQMGYRVVTRGQKYATVGDVGYGSMSCVSGFGGRYCTFNLLPSVEEPTTVAGSYSRF